MGYLGEKKIRLCSVCGKKYKGHPALSRTDNMTPICPDCGVRQSLSSIGVCEEEQEKILESIHKLHK